MKMPPFLLGAALLLWGWQLGQLWLGVLAALVLEGAAGLPWRWAVDAGTCRRAAVVCKALLVGVLGVGAVFAVRRDLATGISMLMAWLPLVALPPAVLQAWGEGVSFDWRVLLPARLRSAQPPLHRACAWPLWAACLLAASVSPTAVGRASQMTWFYPALCLVLGGGLWSWRRPGIPAWRWWGVMLCAAALGLALHTGLHRTQSVLEEQFGEWFLGMESGGEPDPARSSTAIGRIGKLKLSDAIVLRVTFAGVPQLPLLLREARYDHYNSGTWLAARPQARPLALQAGTLRLAETPLPAARLTVRLPLKQGSGLLALPASTTTVGRLTGLRVSQTRLGALLVEDGPSRLDYPVAYLPSGALDTDLPTELDRDVPPALARLFAEEASAWGLSGLSPAQAANRIGAHFQQEFRYSLQQRERGDMMPLRHFMRESRAGHCEYFATATVMLLRSLGIPARYVTGYSVQEFSALEGAYVARARHAHAWAQFHDGTAWQDLDTTPARWAEIESEQANPLQPVLDFFYWLQDRVFVWWAGLDAERARPALAGLLVPLLAWGAWRLIRARRARPSTRVKTVMHQASVQGMDSAWYRLEHAFAVQGLGRMPCETPAAWLHRVRTVIPFPDDELDALCRLHERYRFDPLGLSEQEQQQLRVGVLRCLTPRAS